MTTVLHVSVLEFATLKVYIVLTLEEANLLSTMLNCYSNYHFIIKYCVPLVLNLIP